MTTITKHKRGFFGWIFLILFWAFQAAMAVLVYANTYAANSAANDEAAGALLFLGAFAVIGWFIWLLGTVILGILVLATRGKSVTTVVAGRHEPRF
jgi:hypothetical protein